MNNQYIISILLSTYPVNAKPCKKFIGVLHRCGASAYTGAVYYATLVWCIMLHLCGILCCASDTYFAYKKTGAHCCTPAFPIYYVCSSFD